MFQRYASVHTNQLYKRFTLVLLLVIVIPLTLITAFSYVAVRKERESSTNAINQLYLEETANAVQSVLLQVDSAYQQLCSRREFANFEDSYVGNRYERTHAVNDVEKVALNAYYELKQDVFYELSVLRNLSDFVDSVYFYDNSKELVLTDTGVEYRLDKFYDNGWTSVLAEHISYLTILPTRPIYQAGMPDRSVITLAYRSANQQDNVFVINIDAQRMFSDVFEMFPGKSTGDFLVMNAERELIYASGTEVFERYQNVVFDPAGEQVNRNLADRENLVSLLYNKNFNWLFLTATDANLLYHDLRNMAWLFVLSGVVIFVLAVLFVSLFSARMYNPVLSVMDQILGQDKRKAKPGHELELFHHAAEELMAEKDKLEQRLEESKPVYIDKFLLSLLQDSRQRNVEEIRETLNYLGIELELSDIVLAVIRLEYGMAGENASYSEMVTHSMLVKKSADILAAGSKHVTIQSANDEYILLMNAAEGLAAMRRPLEAFQQAVTESLGVACNIGVGKPCLTVEDLPRACDEARNILTYNVLLSDGGVFYADEKQAAGSSMQYPAYEMRKLVGHIAAGERDLAMQTFQRVRDGIFSSMEEGHAASVRYVLMRMLTELLTALAETDGDLAAAGLGSDIYTEVAACNDINLIFSAFYAIVDRAIAQQNEGMEEAGNAYVDQIVNLLAENCGAEVTLRTLADRLEISTTYISRLFKRYMGITFMDYLTGVRMEKAKELLLIENKKVKEIAAQLGYSGSDYFIRLFKQHTGYTPGEYKKIMK